MSRPQKPREVVFTIEYRKTLGHRLEDLIEEELDTLREQGDATVIKAEIREAQ